ncbi:hypothetical protein [Natronorubrum sp. A-ect3]|uniref:hypothetical protein n=1 Tax=Natronorubrum sp. A-ect3 TaxID=3242698 RepID=UPI00359E5BCA
MARTPLVAPDTYFARGDAFSPGRAVVLVVAFWAGLVAIGLPARVLDEFGVAVGLQSLAISSLRTTLLYWLLPSTILYVLGYLTSGIDSPVSSLILGAWALVPALAARVLWILLLYGAVLLDLEPLFVPAGIEYVLSIVFILLACGWAATIWRVGLHHEFGLTRSTATSVAVLTAGLCAGLFVVSLGV